MQTARRRPLGDIGNTLCQFGAKDKSKPEARLQSNSSGSPRVDERHRHNHLHAVDYLKDIYQHFRTTETLGRPSNSYISDIQTDINDKMRVILVDWLVDVHLKFKLMPETLYLAVEITDRFLSRKVVNRSKLQLVGVVAMLLAAKYEEIYPPEIKDFVYIAANTYTRDDILRMERLMFQTLNFNLTLPTSYVFLKRGLQVMDADLKTSHLAQYLAELALVDNKMLQFSPSEVAAGSIYVANKCMGSKECWGRVLEHYTTLKSTEVEAVAAAVLGLARSAPSAPKTQAVRKKFSYAKYSEVSKIPSLETVQL